MTFAQALAAATAAVAVTLSALAVPTRTAHAQANTQFLPSLPYRTGPYAPNGVPFANGRVDYFALINERDGGINGVRIAHEECETGYDTARGVECYERLKGKGPTGAAVFDPQATGITFALTDKVPTDKVPLITARNNYRLAIEALRLALGFTTPPTAAGRNEPAFAGTLDFTPRQFDRIASLEAARANRPDLARLARLSESREEAVSSARSGGLPTVSAFGGWALRKGPTGSFGDSNNGWLLGVQSDWAIFDGRATQGRVVQARSALAQTQLALGEARLAVEVEVSRAHSQWQQASELAEASARVVGQATEAVRLANARYNAGTGSNLRLDGKTIQMDAAIATSDGRFGAVAFGGPSNSGQAMGCRQRIADCPPSAPSHARLVRRAHGRLGVGAGSVRPGP